MAALEATGRINSDGTISQPIDMPEGAILDEHEQVLQKLNLEMKLQKAKEASGSNRSSK